MLDFKKKNLFINEVGEYNKFVDHRLQTKTEYNENEREQGEQDGPIASDEFIGGDSFDLGDSANFSMDNLNGDVTSGFGAMGDGFGMGMDAGNRELQELENDQNWGSKTGITKFLSAPIYLAVQSVKHWTIEAPKDAELRDVLLSFEKYVGIMVPIFLISWLLKFNLLIYSAMWAFIIFLVATLVTDGFLAYKWHVGIIAKVMGLKPVEIEEPESDADNLFGASDTLGDDMFGLGDNSDGMDFGFGSPEDEDDTEVEDVEDDGVDHLELPDSPIITSDWSLFENTLLSVFSENKGYTGQVTMPRDKMVQSFGKYLVSNKGDNSFGKYTVLKERSNEYNQLSYALYKGFSAVSPEMKKKNTTTGEFPKLTVFDIKRTPLLYIATVKVPDKINAGLVSKKRVEFENMFKASSSDDKVNTIIESYQGKLVIKLMIIPEDAKDSVNVSTGDILRFKGEKNAKGETILEQFVNPKLGMPVLFGLENNEHPTLVDYEENTSGIVVGGSGAGKSWTFFDWMVNFLISNSPKDVQFIVLDMKNSNYWKTFALMPHVLALHGDDDKDKFNDYLDEIEAERLRRQKYLQSIGMEDVKGARKKFKKKAEAGDPYAQEVMDNLPLLNVIIDEITATRAYYQGLDDKGATDKQFTAKLGALTAKARSAGIRVFQIGQRATDQSIFKTSRANSSLAFGMKMTADSDFNIMFGNEVDGMKLPDQRGLGLMKAEGVKGIKSIKSLTLGSADDDQMTALIRTMAFDWIRRTAGSYDPVPKPLNTEYSADLYNRPELFGNAKEDLKAGMILSANPKEATPAYGYDLDELSSSVITEAPKPVTAIEQDVPAHVTNEHVEEPELVSVSADSKPTLTFDEPSVATTSSKEEPIEAMNMGELAGPSVAELLAKANTAKAVAPVKAQLEEKNTEIAKLKEELHKTKQATIHTPVKEPKKATTSVEDEPVVAKSNVKTPKHKVKKATIGASKQVDTKAPGQPKVLGDLQADAKAMPVEDFMVKYGNPVDGGTVYQMTKLQLEDYYGDSLKRALQLNKIVSDGDYYLVAI